MNNLFVVVYKQSFVCACGCDKDVNEVQEYFVDKGHALDRALELADRSFVYDIKVHKVVVENGRLVPGPVCQMAEG